MDKCKYQSPDRGGSKKSPVFGLRWLMLSTKQLLVELQRNHQRCWTLVGIRLLLWCRSGADVWQRHIGRSQVGRMRMTFFRMPTIYMRLKWKKSLTSCTGGIYLKINLNGRVHAINLWKLLRNDWGWTSWVVTLIHFPPRTPSNLSTPINLDSDDTPTTEVGGIIQAMGRKAVKRKAKAKPMIH